MAIISVTRSAVDIIAADTDDNELVFADECVIDRPSQQALIEVLSGTIKFSVGKAINADTDIPALTVGQKLVVTLVSGTGKKNLHFKAANAAESFRVSI